jgi:hypothetical protein
MHIKFALIGLLAIPSLALAANDVATVTTNDAVTVSAAANGVLGVNNVYGYGIYEHSTFADSSHYDYKGSGLGINQHVYCNATYGIDAGFNYEYWTDASSAPASYYKCNAYTLSATGYIKAKYSPFVTAAFYRDNSSYLGASNTNSTWFAGRIGVEMHLSDAWYVTPSVNLWQRIHSDDPASSACADFTVETGYWFFNRVCTYANVNYREMNSAEQLWTNFGLRVRY